MTPRDCARCGAALGPDGACPWCGAPTPPPPPPVAPPPRAEPTVGERLRALRASPRWAALASTERLSEALAATRDSILPRVIALVALATMTLVVFTQFSSPFFATFRILFVVVASAMALFVIVGAGAARARSRARTPPERIHAVPACYIASRLDAQPAARGDGSATYYAGLEFEDGSHGEYLIDGSLVTRLRSGEIGAAFVSGGVLLDFRPAN